MKEPRYRAGAELLMPRLQFWAYVTALGPAANCHRYFQLIGCVAFSTKAPLLSLQRYKTSNMANVQEYIDKHGLQKKVEDVLNVCVKSKPDEPLSFMVRSYACPKLFNCYSSDNSPNSLRVQYLLPTAASSDVLSIISTRRGAMYPMCVCRPRSC